MAGSESRIRQEVKAIEVVGREIIPNLVKKLEGFSFITEMPWRGSCLSSCSSINITHLMVNHMEQDSTLLKTFIQLLTITRIQLIKPYPQGDTDQDSPDTHTPHPPSFPYFPRCHHN